MDEFIYRTEDLTLEEVRRYFTDSPQDREIIDSLKSRTPVILIGSRGVGKSFLLKVAEAELLDEFEDNRVFPIYVTFTKSSLVQSRGDKEFTHWMLARLCAAAARTLRKQGLIADTSRAFTVLSGSRNTELDEGKSAVEAIAESYEDVWSQSADEIDTRALPDADSMKEALEDLAADLDVKRFIFLIDEAAHILLPSQQRLFFTLFRDLRSPILACKAAVYPGATFYGEIFQPTHDATLISLNRDILANDYVSKMREMITKQAPIGILGAIERHGQNFALLAYAASGNPRILMTTLSAAPNLSSSQINEVIREYYRGGVWAEHLKLQDKYPGYRALLDWGRNFIENNVAKRTKQKNDAYIENNKPTTSFFWIERYAPEAAYEALRLLEYTGIVVKESEGLIATRKGVGTRYQLNVGCLLARESNPSMSGWNIVKRLTIKRFTEYSNAHAAFASVREIDTSSLSAEPALAVEAQLRRSIDDLDVTDFQKQKLRELGLETWGEVLRASDAEIQQAYYLGRVRTSQIKNAAAAAVLEYLAG